MGIQLKVCVLAPAGVLAEFIKFTAWLFHEHLEPKYPDKYRPPQQAMR